MKIKLTLLELVFLLANLTIGSWATAQERALDSFVPSSAIAAVVVKPKAMLSQPSFELVPHELLKVFGEQELGLDLLEVTDVLITVDKISDPSMNQPPNVGLIVKFATPQDLKSQITDQMTTIEIEGRKSYSDSRNEFALLLLDKTTLVAGTTGFLTSLLKENKTGKTSEFVNSMQNGHIGAVVQLDSIRDLIKSAMPPREQVPPPFDQFLVLPDLVKSISYRGNFSSEPFNELVIEANNERDARRLSRLIDDAVEWGKSAALTALVSQIEMTPEYEAATVVYAERLKTALKSGIQPKIEGNRLVFDLKGLQGATVVNAGTVGIMVAMLLPAVQQVREAARRSTSQNNLKQIGLALFEGESATTAYPIQNTYGPDGIPLLSWRVHLLPYLGEDALFAQFKLDEPWNSKHNIQLLDKMPSVYQNPNNPDKSKTQYLGIFGPGAAFQARFKVGMRHFARGTAVTATVVEANPEMAVEWSKPQDLEIDKNNPLHGLGKVRQGRFLVAMADTSVQLIPLTISAEKWYLMTRLREPRSRD